MSNLHSLPNDTMRHSRGWKNFCAGILASVFTAAMPQAFAQSASQFTTVTLDECDRAFSVQTDNAGYIYVACSGKATSRANDIAEIVVSRFDRTGKRDPRWAAPNISSVRFPYAGEINQAGSNVFGLIYASPARDGGFWIITNGGRILKFLGDGTFDSAYSSRYARGDGNAEIKDALNFEFFGLVQHPDGSLTSLLELQSDIPGVRKMSVQHVLPDGRFGSLNSYSIGQRFQRFVAWNMNGTTLELLEQSTADGTVPLKRIDLGIDGTETSRIGPPLPFTAESGYFDSAFYLLGDGKMLFGSPSSIYRWTPNGLPDPTFGLPGQTGYRLEPASHYYLPCVPKDFGVTMTLRQSGDVTFFYSNYNTIFSVSCIDRNVVTLDSTGTIDTFATPETPLRYNPVARVDLAGGLLFLGSSTLFRTETPAGTVNRTRADINVVEYYNENLGHYFMTPQEDEVVSVDQGGAGPGWKRTGHVFSAWNIDTPMPGTETVCRFYGDLKAGPNSHFYSAEKFECDLLSALEIATPLGMAAWRFERNTFRVAVPVNGICHATLVPVYRLYNRGSEKGIESNHRFVTTKALYDSMQAQGWQGEGVHMCAAHN